MRNVNRCTAFRSCRRIAKYDVPGFWCSKHWLMWWKYGMKGKEDLPYMRLLNYEGGFSKRRKAGK